MATYIMSDLHGDWGHFRLMLFKIRFSSTDQLYIIGDVVDRGPHGVKLLQYIRCQQNMTLLMGNHELMLLEGILHSNDPLEEEWFDPQTFEELNRLSADERTDLAKYLTTLPLQLTIFCNGTDYLLVHASPAPPEADREDALQYLLWNRVTKQEAAAFSQTVIAGHTPTAYYQNCVPLRIWRYKNYMDIDCGTAFRSILPGGCLACLRLEDGKEFYT